MSDEHGYPEAETAQVDAGLGPWDRMVAVIMRPGDAFRGLRGDRWSWLVPALLICVAMSTAPQLVFDLHYQRQLDALETMIDRGVLTEEQAQEALTRLEEDAGDRPAAAIAQQIAIGTVSNLALRFALPAALLLAGLAFVMERRLRYPAVLATLSFAALPALVRELVRTPLQYSKGSLDVYFGPAALVGHTETLGAYALSLIDLFDAWILGLLIVGLADVAQISRSRAAMLVLPLWLVLALLKLGIKATPLGAVL